MTIESSREAVGPTPRPDVREEGRPPVTRPGSPLLSIVNRPCSWCLDLIDDHTPAQIRACWNEWLRIFREVSS